MKKSSESLQSQVLIDLLKQEGFSATESKGAQTAVEAAFYAMRKAEEEVLDLIQLLGMHFSDPEDIE